MATSSALELGIHNTWSKYKTYVHTVMYDSALSRLSIEQWRNTLFITIMTYALPLSLFALIPSMFIECLDGHFFIAIFEVSALAIISIIVLNRKLSLHHRRLLVSLTTLVFSTVIIAFMAAFTVGYIYLFSLSIFVSTQFPGKRAFYGWIASFMVCLMFGLILTFKLFSVPLQADVTASRWLIYSSNFLFIDAVVVYIIYQLIQDVEKKTIQESFLQKELKNQISLKNKHLNAVEKQNKKLKEIAHMQSHVIRVPLANIMGLSNLIIQSNISEDDQELLIYFDKSIKQLDTVIQDIVQQTSDHGHTQQ
jgi:signal transduction histidine kinase